MNALMGKLLWITTLPPPSEEEHHGWSLIRFSVILRIEAIDVKVHIPDRLVNFCDGSIECGTVGSRGLGLLMSQSSVRQGGKYKNEKQNCPHYYPFYLAEIHTQSDCQSKTRKHPCPILAQ
jgi:hypothetical protein